MGKRPRSVMAPPQTVRVLIPVDALLTLPPVRKPATGLSRARKRLSEEHTTPANQYRQEDVNALSEEVYKIQVGGWERVLRERVEDDCAQIATVKHLQVEARHYNEITKVYLDVLHEMGLPERKSV